MSTEETPAESKADPVRLWTHVANLLPHMPMDSRVAVVQELICKVGPVPNHLGDRVRALISKPA